MEEPGDQVEGLIDQPQAIAPQRFDRLTHREVPPFWGLVGGVVEDGAKAECLEHTSAKAEVVQHLTAVHGVIRQHHLRSG